MQRSVFFSSLFLLCAGLIQFACTQDFDQFTPQAGSGGSGATGGGDTGGGGGTGGIGGAGGAGGGTTSSSSSSSGTIMCTKNPDCPMSNQCEKWACDTAMNVCVQTFTAAGTPIVGGSDMPGNCKIEVCNGTGQSVLQNDDTDVPMDDGNDCTIETCNNGTPSTTNAMAGDPCMNGVCDDMGNCVECLVDNDCQDGANPSCFMNQCISCSDGMKNGDETDIDCGGTQCDKCLGDPCAANNDCVSNFCADGVCCNTACDTACKSCAIDATKGTCTNLPLGMTDNAPTCDGTNVCNGNGVCKLKNGEMCTNDNQCASNNCPNNTKVCTAP